MEQKEQTKEELGPKIAREMGFSFYENRIPVVQTDEFSIVFETTEARQHFYQTFFTKDDWETYVFLKNVSPPVYRIEPEPYLRNHPMVIPGFHGQNMRFLERVRPTIYRQHRLLDVTGEIYDKITTSDYKIEFALVLKLALEEEARALEKKIIKAIDEQLKPAYFAKIDELLSV